LQGRTTNSSVTVTYIIIVVSPVFLPEPKSFPKREQNNIPEETTASDSKRRYVKTCREVMQIGCCEPVYRSSKKRRLSMRLVG